MANLIPVCGYDSTYAKQSSGYICTPRYEGRPERRRAAMLPVVLCRSIARAMVHGMGYGPARKWFSRIYIPAHERFVHIPRTVAPFWNPEHPNKRLSTNPTIAMTIFSA